MTYGVEDSDGDEATMSFDMEIKPSEPAEPDTRPSFGAQTVPERTYTAGVEIDPLVLPPARGGNAPLRYSLTPEIPGLWFDAGTRTLSGTPTEDAVGVHTMTYKGTDRDGDEATMSFDVRISDEPGNPGPACAFSSWPLPGDINPANLELDWCRLRVSIQSRSQALAAEATWCEYKAGTITLEEAALVISYHHSILERFHEIGCVPDIVPGTHPDCPKCRCVDAPWWDEYIGPLVGSLVEDG